MSRIDNTEEGWEALDGIMIDNLHINCDNRGQGHAKALMAAAIEFAVNETMYLICCPKDEDTDFDRLVEFYESFGFVGHELAANMPDPLMVRY
jgi:GNAT superfamily N-acetyltransferase